MLLEVPGRKGLMLRISPNISQSKMHRWRRQAGAETKNRFDSLEFACYVLGHTTVGIEMGGEEVMDEDGYPMNFASAAILKMTSADRSKAPLADRDALRWESRMGRPSGPLHDTVRNFFGNDDEVELAAFAVLEAAGHATLPDTSPW